MADLQIPREAVDKAARALLKHDLPGDQDRFDEIHPKWQHNMREHAMSALNAAAPIIVAAYLDGLADEMASEPKRSNVMRQLGVSDDAIDVLTGALDGMRDELRQRAEQLRAQA